MLDVVVPGLADQAHHVRVGGDQSRELGVFGGVGAGVPCRAEGDERRRLEIQFGFRTTEELVVLRVRPRPSAFDEGNPEVVEEPADGEFVPRGERDALLLGPVSQRRVVDLDRGHGVSCSG